MYTYDVGQGLNNKSSTWFAMGGLGPLTQTVFSFGGLIRQTQKNSIRPLLVWFVFFFADQKGSD